MSGPGCKKTNCGSWNFEGKWVIVMILLALLHLISFTWMIHLQMKVYNLQQLIRAYENVDADEENDAQGDPYVGHDEDIQRVARGARRKTRIEKHIEKCCKRIKRFCKSVEQTPRAERQTLIKDRRPSSALQLRGIVDGDSINDTVVVHSWSLDFPKSYVNGDMLRFDEKTGSIIIMKPGYYYVYAQMQPELIRPRSDGEKRDKFWDFTIYRNPMPDDGGEKLVNVKLCYSSTGCSKGATKSSLVGTIAKYLQKNDVLRIKVNDYTQWFSNKIVQTFGVFSI